MALGECCEFLEDKKLPNATINSCRKETHFTDGETVHGIVILSLEKEVFRKLCIVDVLFM